MKQAINATRYLPFQNTNTQQALRVMRTELFGTSGDRDFVQNIAIVVTDGQSTIRRLVQNVVIVVTNGQYAV